MACPGITVSEVNIRLLRKPRKDGVIGYASCIINGAVKLDNIKIRVSEHGKTVLSYPSKLSRSQTQYYYFIPVSHEAGRILEKAIIDRLDFRKS